MQLDKRSNCFNSRLGQATIQRTTCTTPSSMATGEEAERVRRPGTPGGIPMRHSTPRLGELRGETGWNTPGSATGILRRGWLNTKLGQRKTNSFWIWTNPGHPGGIPTPAGSRCGTPRRDWANPAVRRAGTLQVQPLVFWRGAGWTRSWIREKPILFGFGQVPTWRLLIWIHPRLPGHV